MTQIDVREARLDGALTELANRFRTTGQAVEREAESALRVDGPAVVVRPFQLHIAGGRYRERPGCLPNSSSSRFCWHQDARSFRLVGRRATFMLTDHKHGFRCALLALEDHVTTQDSAPCPNWLLPDGNVPKPGRNGTRSHLPDRAELICKCDNQATVSIHSEVLG